MKKIRQKKIQYNTHPITRDTETHKERWCCLSVLGFPQSCTIQYLRFHTWDHVLQLKNHVQSMHITLQDMQGMQICSAWDDSAKASLQMSITMAMEHTGQCPVNWSYVSSCQWLTDAQAARSVVLQLRNLRHMSSLPLHHHSISPNGLITLRPPSGSLVPSYPPTSFNPQKIYCCSQCSRCSDRHLNWSPILWVPYVIFSPFIRCMRSTQLKGENGNWVIQMENKMG